jgi:hypothetical protein
MKLVAVVLLAFGLGACTPREDAQAHEELHRAKVDAEKAGSEIDKDLHTSRDKIRKAIGETDDKDRR